MRFIPTGLKHGTITVLCNGTPYEITTYRIDGKYTDHRRPDNVEFTSDIKADLARRDFTINAVAMDINGCIIDPFNGIQDMKDGLIRCVGEPEKRFTEDALRIMRAVRFASQLNFNIEINTSEAVHRMKDLLQNISHERIRDELDKLVCGLGYSRRLTTRKAAEYFWGIRKFSSDAAERRERARQTIESPLFKEHILPVISQYGKFKHRLLVKLFARGYAGLIRFW